jgi:hypothetical protein
MTLYGVTAQKITVDIHINCSSVDVRGQVTHAQEARKNVKYIKMTGN